MTSSVTTAIVTGGASGIGAACVRRLAMRGINVLVADVQDDLGTKLTEELKAVHKVDAIYVHVDVSSEMQVEAMVKAAVKRWGRLDYAANVAGICPDGDALRGDESKVSTEMVDRVFAINQRGVWLCQKYEAQQMMRQDPRPLAGFSSPSASLALKPQRGAIVNIGSTTSTCGMGFAAYTPTKHAVVGVTRNGAFYYGPHGIRCNAVSPGGTATPMSIAASPEDERDRYGGEDMELVKPVPLRRFAIPEEQANVVSFLLSSEASYVNGVNLLVDGGWDAARY